MTENLAYKWWPEFFQQPRSYFTEAEIIEDMYQKARVSPNSLHLIIHSDRAQMKRIHKMAGHAVRQYYGINDAEYPLPEGVDGEEFSLRIMLALWDRFNEEHQ